MHSFRAELTNRDRVVIEARDFEHAREIMDARYGFSGWTCIFRAI